MNPTDVYAEKFAALKKIFHGRRDKYEAHRASRPVLEEMAAEAGFVPAVMRKYLAIAGVWNRGHYPVLGGGFELDPYMSLDVNIWVPLANGDSDLSTKAIHHHGRMILSTVTVFGPGYDHWTFRSPVEMDGERELFRLELLEHGQHGKGGIAFVDAHIAHVPFFPAKLSITVALWSNSAPTTWRDHAKRMPFIKERAKTLRKVGKSVGLAKGLDLKADDYLDYYPTPQGFKGMRERKEFAHGPNENFVANMFYVLQQTGCESLARLCEGRSIRGRGCRAAR